MAGRRELIQMTDAEVEAFLAVPRSMTVASLGADGRPHLVAMWFGFLDGAPAFWTYGRSQKIVNLRRDPRITCLVEAGETYDQLQGVQLVGTGEVLEDQESIIAVAGSVYERYNGPFDDTARAAVTVLAQKRVAVRIHVESVVSWDHRKLGGVY